MPGPAGEEVGLGPAGLDRLDRLQAAQSDGHQLAPLHQEPLVLVHPTPRDPAEGDEVERRDPDPDQGQDDVILEHDDREETH